LLGALLLCIAGIYKEMTGHELKYEIYGKPYASIYRFTEKLIEKDNNGKLPSRIYAIGDNPLSDIKGTLAILINFMMYCFLLYLFIIIIFLLISYLSMYLFV
jgi:ribonucleotide monophosphatase NagD (HAD superfamily)